MICALNLQRRIESVIAQEETSAAKARLLRSIPGIGPVSAAMLIAEMPELDRMTSAEAGAMTGLAPVPHYSGAMRGRRAIAGGRRSLRHVPLQVALAAACHNPVLKPVAQRLKMRGKPHKLVIVAIARMPVIIANAILKTGVPWRQYTRWTAVSCTVRILSAAAPEADWSRHRHLVNRLSREARRSRSNRKTGRVLPSGMLLDVGERLASAISQEQHMALASALTVRDGAMVALIALMPMRRRSFSELRLGTSVLVSSERIVISLSPEMTKNGLPWEAQVPESGVGLLRRYIDQTRPWLMNRVQKEHDTLWIGRCGEPLTDAAIADRIATVTARMTGVRVSPHLFRDAAATTLARQSPADARLIRPLLAHSGFGTAERHYIQAQGIETGRDFASVIAELSKGDG